MALLLSADVTDISLQDMSDITDLRLHYRHAQPLRILSYSEFSDRKGGCQESTFLKIQIKMKLLTQLVWVVFSGGGEKTEPSPGNRG